MRKVLLLFVILLIPFTLAMDFDYNPDIPQGQTAIVKISGGIIDPITKDNIKFYRGHTQTSFDHDVGRIGNAYYLYFQTQNKPLNNYSFVVEGVRHYINGNQISNEDVSQNFTITSGLAYFYINPGFIIDDENSSIYLKNLNPSTLSVSVNHAFGNNLVIVAKNNEISSGDSFTLSDVEELNIYLYLYNTNETTTGTITLSSSSTSYEIPVYFVLSSQGSPFEENTSTTTENQTQNETTTETKNETDDGSFWDLFKKENKTESNVTNSTVIVDENGNVVEKDTTLKTCSQLNGSVCLSDQICQDGNVVNAKDSSCCISACVDKTQSNSGKIIGWVLIGVIVLFLLWFRAKYKRTRRKRFVLPSRTKRRF